MEVRRRSSKEPSRRMHYEVRPRTQRTASYGAGLSDPSSQGENMEIYYNEAKYLSKEQMKAYIHKMKKEIKNYKLREMNYKIEIKYLRRKIERLKGIIQNDTFFLNHQRGGSVRSHHSGFSFKSGMNKVNSEDGTHAGWYKRGNISEGNYHHRGYTQKYDSARDGGHHDRNRSHSYSHGHGRNRSNSRSHSHSRNRSRVFEDNRSEAKFSNVSIRSINASIHNNKRINVRNFNGRFSDTCRRSDHNQVTHLEKVQADNNTRGSMDRFNSLKKHSRDHSRDHLRDHSRDHFVHTVPMAREVKKDNPCEDRMCLAIKRGSDSFRSNRSCSCTSKFKLKSHLISNSNHIRNMSSDINNTISKDIKNYYSSKQSILSGTSQQLLNRNSSSVQKGPSGRKDVESKTDSCGKHMSIEKLSKLTPREIKKKINCDFFDYAHHQRILRKKYISPYAFKRDTSLSRMASCGKVTQRSGSQVNAAEEKNGEDNGELSDGGDSIKRVKLYLDKQREKRNPPAVSTATPSMPSTMLTAAPTTPSMPSTTLAATPTSAKKHDGVSARGGAKAVTTGTVLISKEKKKSETNSNAKGSHTEYRDGTHLKTNQTKQRQNVLESIKKSIDSDIKENFKKELEELKRRKDILVSKRSDYCDLSFGSTSSSDSSRGGRRPAEGVGNPSKGGAQCKAVNNPLKESSILNISFNDLDKRINNLKNYLKNSNA
ncbi:hypothetical protein PCYB_051440 [Plasmodium cynomolgi strain B]|uniref:Uncharacterized protein n=1 Tax=Plasmodium cynomolgi (strain B) TaxID=1120755 RepID=K6UCM8_PLACD|nr:hypothetical protein PCYB_051440 [Plasmodium cynomolgi strain B]GAB65126.1 hypothetical protein PCYB_051440 [Plasmodium cynomolgi strain B]